MNPAKRSEEQVIEEFRHLLAHQSQADQRDRNPIHWAGEWFSFGGERVAGMLERAPAFSLATCLCAFMAVVLLMPQSNSSKISATAPVVNETVASFDAPLLEDDLAEESLPPKRTASFIVRVGSFRNQSNAQRLTQSLRERKFDVKTEARANGLFIVTVGPFTAKNLAEDTARSVSQAVGLDPQVRLLPE
jgi:hypothetical protein